MKVVLLAGGCGSRLSEETTVKPKPMVNIGDMPIICHIMHIYGAFGYKDFIVACGYKGDVIKEYFHKIFYHQSDFIVNLADGSHMVTRSNSPNWRVQLVDTGLHTMTGGRLKRLKPFIENQTFMATYGDGVGNIAIDELVDFHQSHGKLATITAVRPPARFGSLVFDGKQVVDFTEKPQTGEGWINGGFFVLEPEVLDYIDSDEMPFERKPLERLAADGQLMSFFHEGFWQPMDTVRDKTNLECLWNSDKAPWRIW